MADQYLSSLMDPTRSITFEAGALLTTSTINALHFPGLTTSGMSDACAGNRASFFLDGVGMCESMTESFCSTGGGHDDISNMNNTSYHQSDMTTSNSSKTERRDSTTQKRRRSRKAQYDASIDGTSLDKIETVNLIDEQNEPDDAWLFEVPMNNHNNKNLNDNIFSWVHKEFKSNDINACKHRLLCKLDDMSHARTIRSVSCHNFAHNQLLDDNFKRSPTDQPVHSEPMKNGRLSSPLRTITSLFNENINTRSLSPSNVTSARTANVNLHTNTNPIANEVRSRDISKEREKTSLDYTDIEVMAKVQLENLRQAERQGPLSKRFGGSNLSLASTSSGTSGSISNRSGTKPPVAPKPSIIKNNTKVNALSKTNTQTIVSKSKNETDSLATNEAKPPLNATRASVLPPNSANNIRTRPPIARPIQTYRGSQTTFNNNSKTQITPSSYAQRNANNLYLNKECSSNGNGLLNDVSNRPLTAPVRSQVGPQRRTILPQSTTCSSVQQISSSSSTDVISNQQSTTIPRSSSSSLSLGRKSGIPMVGKAQKPSRTTLTRPASSKLTSIPSQSMESTMATRIIRNQGLLKRPQISDSQKKITPAWDDGCY